MLSDNLIYKSYYNWWKNINKTVLILIVILFGLGLFFSLVSTSLIASDKLNTNSYYFFIKHLLFIVTGVFFIIFFSSLKNDDLIKVSRLFFILFLFFLILVPFFGVEVKGSKRWMEIPFLLRFQPIELLKPFLIVVLASVLIYENKKNLYYKFFFKFFNINANYFAINNSARCWSNLIDFSYMVKFNFCFWNKFNNLFCIFCFTLFFVNSSNISFSK